MSDPERMIELLRYANRTKVAAALKVSPQTTNQWAKGRDVTPFRLHQVEDLLRPQRANEVDPTNGELLTEMRAIRRLLQRQAVPAVNAQQLAKVVVDALAQREAARPGPGSRKPARDASPGRKGAAQPAGTR